MKRGVLSRYERGADNTIIIDVAATRVEDLYNDFDKNAPYIRRDLDQDLVEYLIDCARELNGEPYIIRFTLMHPPDAARQSRIRRSVNNFFQYRVDTEKQHISRMFCRSMILFSIGLAILFISVSVNPILSAEESVAANMLAEGLTVAAWVSLWEALAIFLIGWFPHRRQIHLFQRLGGAELTFRADASSGSGAE